MFTHVDHGVAGSAFTGSSIMSGYIGSKDVVVSSGAGLP